MADFILNSIQLKSGGKQKCMLLSLLSNCSGSTNQAIRYRTKIRSIIIRKEMQQYLYLQMV